jgi:hypothetical protein
VLSSGTTVHSTAEATTVGDIVDLHGRSKPFQDDPQFIQDMARFADGVLSEAQIRKKYRLAAGVWDALGSDDELVERIEAEKLRRTRDGCTAREKAQKIFTRVPEVLSSVMDDPGQSARHRIDACKEVRAVAANGPEAAPTADRFIININLGTEVLHFDKPRAPMIENSTVPVITDKQENDGDESV